MIRVAGLMRQDDAGTAETAADGMTSAEQLEAIRGEVANIVAAAHKCSTGSCCLVWNALGSASGNTNNYRRHNRRELRSIFPTLCSRSTPLAFDPGRPFPHISNLSLNLAVLIRDAEGEEHFARIKVPITLPQLIAVDGPARRMKSDNSAKQQTFVWLEDLIASNLNTLFPGMKILEAHPFHVTRDAEIAIQELEAGDLLENTEEGLSGVLAMLYASRSVRACPQIYCGF